MDGPVFAVSSLGLDDKDYSNEVFGTDAALRSGRETDVRYDPMDRRNRENRKKEDFTTTRPSPPASTPNVKHPQNPSPPSRTPTLSQSAPQKPNNTTIPPPTNPINRQEGWKNSQPSRNTEKSKDVNMKDDTHRSAPSGNTYRFTSDLQETTDPKALLEKLYKTELLVSVKDLIGNSPPLQKLIGEATRTRREYTHREASPAQILSYNSYAAADEDQKDLHELKIAKELKVGVEDIEQVERFIVRYSSAITVMPTAKYFAMVTGVMTVTLNGEPFAAMIDTGSELNLASRGVPERANLPLDFQGMRWSLKGIHGVPEQLAGVVTDAPIKLGSHDFPHHLFVSRHKINQKYDLILGQPFLQWYACRLDYWRSGLVKLFLWKEGDKDRKPNVAICITDPTNERNKTNIDTGPAADVAEAYIEDYPQGIDVNEEDERYYASEGYADGEGF